MNFWDKTKNYIGGRANAAKAYLAEQKRIGDEARARIPQMNRQEAIMQLRDIQMPRQQEINYREMPVVQAFKQRSLRPFAEQFKNPRKLAQGFSQSIMDNAMGGGFGGFGGVVKRLPNRASNAFFQGARKYKSADDFVKAQSKLFHGGTANIKDIKLGKSNFQRTFYMSENPNYANSYGGSKSSLNEIAFDNKAKLADLRKPSSDLVKRIENIISGKPTGKIFKIKKPDGTFIELPEIKGELRNAVFNTSDILRGIKDGKAHYAELPEVKKALQQLGYDGMITQESKVGANYGVWNKNAIKTKSQLNDIWNKANRNVLNTRRIVKRPRQNRIQGRSIPYITQRMDAEDRRIMTDLIDNTRLRRPENVSLEINARRMANAMGFNPDVPNAKLANLFERILSNKLK